MAYYVLDENKNLVLSFDREGFLAILQQAIADQSLANIDPDSAVASKLRSIINGTTHHIEFITAAEYSDLENRGLLVAGTYYFITDDTSEQDLESAISGLIETTDSLTASVQDIVTRVGAVETGKLDEQIYKNDFIIGKDPNTSAGWDDYDTTSEMPFNEGLYLFTIREKGAGTPSCMPSIMLFVSDSTTDDDSALFPLSVSGSLSDCFLRADYFQSGSKKRLQVIRKSNGTQVDCMIFYHKIGGTK